MYAGTQFTCFTSTKVQILTPEEVVAGGGMGGMGGASSSGATELD